MNAMKSFIYMINDRRRDQNILAIIVFVILLGLIYRDVIFYGRTFLMETATAGAMGFSGPYKYKGEQPGFVANDPAAIALINEPMTRFLSNTIKKGNFPLWNPYAGLAGGPFLGDGETGPLEPIQLLFSLTPGRYWPYAVDWQLLFRFLIAGFTCYLFARRQGIDFIGSIAAGALFMFSSYFMTSGNHPQVKTESLLPLVLYGYDRLVDIVDSRKWLWLCALIVGWSIIAAMPEATFFVLFLGSLWYFYKSFVAQKENIKNISAMKSVVIRYLIPTSLGLLISAAYLFPFLEFLLLSKNVHTPGASLNIGGDSAPVVNLLGLIFPLNNLYFLHIGFWSIFTLVFVLVNIKVWSEFRPIILFFGLYATVFTLAIFDFPIINWIHRIPVFDRIVFYKYPIPAIMFSLAMLTGIFVTKVKNAPLSYKKISTALLIILVVLLVIPTANGLNNLYSLHLPESEMKRTTLSTIAITIVTLYIYKFLFKKHSWQIALLFLVIIEPLSWSTRINRPDRYDPYFQQIPPFINYLRDDRDVYRIFGLDGLLYPNVSTAYGISDMRWINALMPQRTYDFTVRFLNSEGPKLMRFTGTEFPISDRMFDLLNVKYVLAKNSGLCNTDNEIIQPKFNFIKQELNVEHLIINKSSRTVIVAVPMNEFNKKIFVSSRYSKLNFSIGLNPVTFEANRGDGAHFQIALMENGEQTILFSKYINPSNNPCDRRWFDESISLATWAGKDVALKFSTDGGPSGDTSWDWAYWGNINMIDGGSVENTSAPALNLAYQRAYKDKNVVIYQNKDVYPRAFVVYDLINADSFNQVLDILTNPDIDLRQTAIVENFPDDFRAVIEKSEQKPSPGSAHVKRISPDDLTVEVETSAPGLLVISEQYYPGWRAYVDGKETHVYAVDGILRGVFLNKGKHTIIFEYKPISFLIGLIVSIISLLATIARLVYLYKQSLLWNY
jgi:hypothetical protein